MSFWSTLGRIGSGVLGALPIPGAGLISGALGSLASGIGGAGNQGSVNTNQTTNQSGTTTSSQTGTTNQNQRGLQTTDLTQAQSEGPEAQAFRSGMFNRLNARLGMNAPVFGDAQKSGFLSNLNDLSGAAMENLKQNLASSGALDSGRFAAGARDIEMGRVGQAGQFFSQLPFLEQQAQDQRFAGLSQIGNQLLSTTPRSGRTTGTQSSEQTGTTETNQTGNMNTTQTGTTSGTTQQQGPDWWRGALSDLGGFLGAGAGQNMGLPGTQIPQFVMPGSAPRPPQALPMGGTPNPMPGQIPGLPPGMSLNDLIRWGQQGR
jgi:hypothetical protein